MAGVDKTITKLGRQEIVEHLQKCRLYLNEPGTTGVIWMGVAVSWQRLAKRDGGASKRNGAWGRYVYEYRDKELTIEEAIQEIMKPPGLRWALIEATTIIECSMCGRVVVGGEALDPYSRFTVTKGGVSHKKPWGIVFWEIIDGEPTYLNFCPACLQAVADGEYKDEEGDGYGETSMP